MDMRKVFYEVMIERVKFVLNVNTKIAKESVDYLIANYPEEYEQQLNEYFDEVHPY